MPSSPSKLPKRRTGVGKEAKRAPSRDFMFASEERRNKVMLAIGDTKDGFKKMKERTDEVEETL